MILFHATPFVVKTVRKKMSRTNRSKSLPLGQASPTKGTFFGFKDSAERRRCSENCKSLDFLLDAFCGIFVDLIHVEIFGAYELLDFLTTCKQYGMVCLYFGVCTFGRRGYI